MGLFTGLFARVRRNLLALLHAVCRVPWVITPWGPGMVRVPPSRPKDHTEDGLKKKPGDGLLVQKHLLDGDVGQVD